MPTVIQVENLSKSYQPGDFPEAERASRETLAIPLYSEMSEEQIDTVAAAMKSAMQSDY